MQSVEAGHGRSDPPLSDPRQLTRAKRRSDARKFDRNSVNRGLSRRIRNVEHGTDIITQ